MDPELVSEAEQNNLELFYKMFNEMFYEEFGGRAVGKTKHKAEMPHEEESGKKHKSEIDAQVNAKRRQTEIDAQVDTKKQRREG
jgi:hypothetical protein